MILRQRLQRNTFWKFIGDGSRVLLAVFLLLVARRYGPAAFGVFSLIYAAGIFFSLVADVGINPLTTRQIAAHKGGEASGYLRTFFTCKLALLPLWLLIPFLWHRYGGHHSASLELVLTLAAAFAMRNLLEFFGAIFSGFEVIHWEAAIKFAANSLMLALGWTFMAQGRSIVWMAAAMAAGYACGAGLGALWCHRKWRIFPLAFHPAGLSILYKESLAMLLVGSSTALLTKWNTLVMGIMGIADAQIGLFGASEKIIAALEVLPALISAASFPIFSDLHRNDPKYFASAQKRLIQLFTATGTVMALGVILLNAPLVRMLYGAPYNDAGTALRLLALGMIVAYPNILLTNLLVASGRPWKAFQAAALALTANIVMTFMMIPVWGMPGSAAAASLSQGLLFAGALYFAFKLVLPAAR